MACPLAPWPRPIRQDADLLTRSGLSVLEEAIATILVPAQEASIRERCRAVVERTVMDQKAILRDQMQGIMAQMDSMRRLKEKTGEKVPKLVAQHQQVLRSFEADRRAFEQKKTAFRAAVEEGLLAPLAPGTFDLIISNAKGEMLSAWTTAGIVERFKSFFADAIARFDAALEGAQQVATLVAEEYQPLQARYHLPQLGAIPYAIMPRRAELLTMAENYERFGMKLEIAVNTQGAVVRKAFLTVASRIRDFVLETRHEAESWVDEIMAVMNRQMEIFQAKSEEELAALESISQAMGNIDTRILQLQRALADRQADMRQVDARWTLLLPLLRQDHPGSELPAPNP